MNFEMKAFGCCCYECDCQGISTYDYIIALREQEQQAVGGQQSPQMSPASSLTGLSSASSFNTFHRGAWCTPPRLFLEDQVCSKFSNRNSTTIYACLWGFTSHLFHYGTITIHQMLLSFCIFVAFGF